MLSRLCKANQIARSRPAGSVEVEGQRLMNGSNMHLGSCRLKPSAAEVGGECCVGPQAVGGLLDEGTQMERSRRGPDGRIRRPRFWQATDLASRPMALLFLMNVWEQRDNYDQDAVAAFGGNDNVVALVAGLFMDPEQAGD